MPTFDHKDNQSTPRRPTVVKAPLLPMRSAEEAEKALEHLIPRALKDGSGDNLSSALDIINGLPPGDLRKVAQSYDSKTGRSLLNDLLEIFRPWIDTRHEVALAIQNLMPNLTWQAFLEQLAYGAAYAQRDDMKDAKGANGETDLGTMLKAVGFKAGPLVRGRWGLQFRTFKPLMHTRLPHRPVVAFRGTEGIRAPWNDPLAPKTREGMVDTWIGDLTSMGAGYPQFQANQQLIERNMKALGKSTVTGHSLGGGLAQIATAKLPSLVAECVSFNAPGINAADAKSLESKKIPTIHHRTNFDIVPSGNSKAAPGTIYSYDRLIEDKAGRGWKQELNPGNTHNNMALAGLLNYQGKQDSQRLTEYQKSLLTKGAKGPTPADHSGQVISSLLSVKPTKDDRRIHGGEIGLLPDVSYKVFRANLGYNLLIEYVENKVKLLDPNKLKKPQILEKLQAVQQEVMGINGLNISAEAYRLFIDMELDKAEKKSLEFRSRIEIGQKIDLTEIDKTAVSRAVIEMWNAWWPEAKL